MHLEIGFDRQNRFLNVSREKMEGMERLGIVNKKLIITLLLDNYKYKTREKVTGAS